MKPTIFTKETEVDPAVTKGYEATYSYTMRLFGLYPVLHGKLYYFFMIYQTFISVAYFWFVFAYLVSTYLAFAYKDEELIPYELCYGLLTLMYFLVAHTVLYRRKDLEGLFRDVGQGFHKYKYARPFNQVEMNIREESDRRCRRLARINVIIAFFLTTCISVPAITKGLQGKAMKFNHEFLEEDSPIVAYPYRTTPYHFRHTSAFGELLGSLPQMMRWLLLGYITLNHVVILHISRLFCRYTTVIEEGVPVNKNLILPVWSPYPISSGTSFWIFSIVELAAANTESFIICANCTLYCNLCTMLGAEIKLLCHSLRNIEDRATYVFETKGLNKPKSGNYYDSRAFQICMSCCIKECIIHHIELKMFLKKFQNFVSFPVFAILSGTALTISSPLFLLLSMGQVPDVSEFIMKLVHNAFLVCSFTYFLSSYCMYGQRLTDDSSDVHMAFYETPWMYCSWDFRRKVTMGMMNSRIPFILSAAGIASASGTTLIEILKSVFSYLNLLRAAHKT